MPENLVANEELVQRLPLPLAQLYRRAHNAKTPLERHNAAYFLWEASLKLIGAVAIVEYAEQPSDDATLNDYLKNVARPALGHWWGFVQRLLPVLAERGDAHFGKTRDLLLGKSRADLPRAAGLDATLREVVKGRERQARTSVNLTELFDLMVRYRNQEIGHGAIGQRAGSYYQSVGNALLAGIPELLARLDCLAGRRLVAIRAVERQTSGDWEVDRLVLTGETARRLEPLAVPKADAGRLPTPQRVYLEGPDLLRCLHPLVIFDAVEEEVLFLNARSHKHIKYLAYTSGREIARPDLGGEQRELLGRILGMAVSDQQVHDWAANSQAQEPPLPAEEAKPALHQLGDFELLSELGRGGMGVVYRAWQPSLGRQVALKKLQKTGDVTAEARFKREIQALGQVDHPNLVKIFTSGAEGDQWFYAMELIEGVPLSAVAERLDSEKQAIGDLHLTTWQEAVTSCCSEARQAEKPLGRQQLPAPLTRSEPDPDFAVEADNAPLGRTYVQHIVTLMTQVAEAAHALHERGIIHRDIKPGNIMVSQDGSQAVLMDLGLAQLADEVEGRLTRTRQFVGTLRYAGPQQILALGRLDRRADVYSLGATLWELLACQPLFAATEAMPTATLMEKIQRDEPQRLRTLHPGLARDLEAIVHKCLEKDPDRRYATAQELTRDLDCFLEGRPVQARPVSGLERAWKWAKRHPATAATYGLTVLVAGLVFLSVAWTLVGGSLVWLWLDADSAREKAKLALKGEQEARVGEALAKRELEHLQYVFQINLVDHSWQAGDVARAREILMQCKQEKPGWEWNHLALKVNPELQILSGHNGPVRHVVFHPDGRRVASCGQADGKVIVWDAAAGTQLYTLLNNKILEPIQAIFSPDGLKLATWSHDGVKIWNAQDGSELASLQGHDGGVNIQTGLTPKSGAGPVQYAIFSPDGKALASAGTFDKTVKIWDTTSFKELQALRGHVQAVHDMVFSPDCKRLAVTNAKAVKIWDVVSGKEALDLEGHTDAVSCVVFSPDGKLLASAGGKAKRIVSYGGQTQMDKTVKVWDATSGKELHTLRSDNTFVTEVIFSPDGKSLATLGFGGEIKLWEASAGRLRHNLPGQAGGAYKIVFSPDAQRLAVVGPTVQIWSASSGVLLRTLHGHTSLVNDAAFSPDGERLATVGDDGTVRIWDATNSKAQHTFHGQGGAVMQMRFDTDGQRLATAFADGTVKVLDASTCMILQTLRGHQAPVVALDSNGMQMASASVDGKVIVWDLKNDKTMPIQAHPGMVFAIALSPDGKLLASVGSEMKLGLGGFIQPGAGLPQGKVTSLSNVKLWDATSGKLQLILSGDTSLLITECVFSPDGKQLATRSTMDQTVTVWDVSTGRILHSYPGFLRGGRSFGGPMGLQGVPRSLIFDSSGDRLAAPVGNIVKVWDTHTGKELHVLQGHSGDVKHVAFTRAGDLLASAGYDMIVKVWDTHTGKELQALRGHAREITQLAFSADGKNIMSVGGDSMVKLWDVVSGQELYTLTRNTHVTLAAFSSDGQRIASAHADDTINIWESAFDSQLLDKRWQVWRDQQATQDARRGQWFAAKFHLDRLMRDEPAKGELYFRRANVLAEQDLWREADVDLAKSIELDPNNHEAMVRRALLMIQLGDDKGRESLLKTTLERCGNTHSAVVANSVAWGGAIHHLDRLDSAQFVALGEKAVMLAPGNPNCLNTLGAALYRAGRYEESVKRLQEAIAANVQGGTVWDFLFLAMAEHRLGHADAAGKWLQKAEDPSMKASTLTWNERLELRLIRDEAEAVLKPPPGPSGKSPGSPPERQNWLELGQAISDPKQLELESHHSVTSRKVHGCFMAGL
jgi:WD40 repeat protein/serine/threonine protein kinase